MSWCQDSDPAALQSNDLCAIVGITMVWSLPAWPASHGDPSLPPHEQGAGQSHTPHGGILGAAGGAVPWMSPPAAPSPVYPCSYFCSQCCCCPTGRAWSSPHVPGAARLWLPSKEPQLCPPRLPHTPMPMLGCGSSFLQFLPVAFILLPPQMQ